MKTQSEGVGFMQSSLPDEFTRSSLHSVEEKEPEKLATLSELTQMSAKDLPEIPDLSQQVKQKRRSRARRSASEGVAMMRAGLTSNTSSADDIAVANLEEESEKVLPKHEAKGVAKMQSICERDYLNGDHPEPSNLLTGHSELSLGRNERKQRRRRMKTQSEGVGFMQSSLPDEFTRSSLHSVEEKEPEKLATLSELTQMSAKDLPEIPDLSQQVKQKRRSRARRSASEGVAMMRAGLTNNITSVVAIKKSTDDISVANRGNNLKKGLPEVCGVLSTTEPAKNKVTFLLAKRRNTPTAVPSLDITDHGSIDSVASDDGESDIDDVPEAIFSDEIIVASQSRMRAIAQKIDLSVFFQGSRYRIISLLFGPMACFFFIAMRVEIFNIYAGVFKDQTDIWYRFLTPSFWIEVSLYCIMIIEMLLALVVFFTKRDIDRALFNCSAAVFGLLINIMCLLLLLIAEMKRCCPDNDNVLTRMLASVASKGYDDPSAEDIECCPKFGERRYGGLGNIEPFTCLIALSPLRFLVADYAVKLFGSGVSHDQDMHSNEGAHHHGPDPTTKVRDLWLTAIGAHSDVAKSFGLFSSELLQCMLGIYSNESDDSKELEASVREPESSDANNESTEHEGSQHNGRENSISDTSSRGLMSPFRPLTLKRYASDDFGVTFDDFAYPKARLIRRMRRCERRLLPLLDEWMVVDVVITSHELVVFDVLDETGDLESTLENGVSSYKNGGKGLHLCDVARGRNIVSQFNLDEVDFVDIEHRAAVLGDIDGEDIEGNRNNNLLEHWQGGNEDYDVDAMNKRWEHVDEDRLKIHFKYNTLYLRFMVDLKEMEHKSKAFLADDSDLMNHVGTQTKVWCRTIARLRGATNLKQTLPHFGNDGADEIEDFIEMCERGHEGGNHNTNKIVKKLHRRMSSLGGKGTFDGHGGDIGDGQRKKIHKRMSSLGENGNSDVHGSDTGDRPRNKIHKRMHSMSSLGGNGN